MTPLAFISVVAVVVFIASMYLRTKERERNDILHHDLLRRKR